MSNKYIIKDQAASVQDVAIATLVNALMPYYPRNDLIGLNYETLDALREYQETVLGNKVIMVQASL